MASAARLCFDEEAAYQDVVFSAGLFADLGVLVFAQTDPQNYPSAYLNHDHHGDLARVERQLYGFDHAALSARLLKRWSFPQDLIDAVAHHQVDSSNGPRLNQAVHAASLMAEVLWVPQSPCLPELQSILQRDFHRDIDGLISLALECKSEFAECAALFQVDLSAGQFDADVLRREAQRLFHLAAMDVSMELDTLEAIVEDQAG